MTMPLAFESISAPASRPAGMPAHAAAAAAAKVRVQIRRELVDDGSDVLWRLTTKPWARARRGSAGVPAATFRRAVEGGVTIASMLGMVFLSVACLIA